MCTRLFVAVLVEAGQHRVAPLATGDQAHVRHIGAQGGGEHRLFVASVRGHHQRADVGRYLTGERRRLVADGGTDTQQGTGNRRVAGDDDERRRSHRLEEDLERAARKAGVVHDELAGLSRFLGRADAQQQWLAGVEHDERLRAHGRLSAGAADETDHRSVGEHQRLIPRLGARGPVGQNDARVHEGDAPTAQLRRPLIHFIVVH